MSKSLFCWVSWMRKEWRSPLLPPNAQNPQLSFPPFNLIDLMGKHTGWRIDSRTFSPSLISLSFSYVISFTFKTLDLKTLIGLFLPKYVRWKATPGLHIYISTNIHLDKNELALTLWLDSGHQSNQTLEYIALIQRFTFKQPPERHDFP